MIIPDWALTLSYWFHMLATVAWIGGLAAIALLILPASNHLNDPEKQAILLENAQRRLDPVAWFSLVLLIGTGLVQMSASPQYDGFLSFTNQWAIAILFKHIVFLGMILISAYTTWFLLPELNRAMIRYSLQQETTELPPLQRRSQMLLRLNLILGLIVLALTALARASG